MLPFFQNQGLKTNPHVVHEKLMKRIAGKNYCPSNTIRNPIFAHA